MVRCSSYADGNCTDGACLLAPWIPEDLGDGGDWAANAPSHGLQVTMIPTAGSVVCYCRGDGYSPYGHCAYVERVNPDGTILVKEMNYVAFNQYDERVSTLSDVCGFILAPGMAPGQGGTGGQGAAGNAVGDLAASWSRLQGYYNGEADQYIRALQDVQSAYFTLVG